MRPLTTFHLPYPDVRAARTALAAGAVAGLVVIAACTDVGNKSLTAPPAPRAATTSSGGFGQAKLLTLCVDPASPLGTYTFVNTKLNRSVGQDGYSSALPGNGWFFNNNYYDPGDGGDGTTIANAAQGVSYTITNQGNLGTPDCVTVLDRTVGNAAFMAKLPIANGGTCDPGTQSCGGINDSFAAATITYLSNTVSATYDHTDCNLDDGVLIPQQANPPNTFPVWPIGGISWDHNNPSGYVCDNHNNPTRGFVNYEHGATLTFKFNPAPPPPAACTLGYPNTSGPTIDGLQRSNVAFNESSVLDTVTRGGNELRLWAVDEHAPTLGVNTVSVKAGNPAVTTVTNYTFTTFAPVPGKTYGLSTSPNVGDTFTTGDQAADDGYDRPLYPSLFITDLTALGNTSKAGDWQYGGTPVAPNAIYGTWKSAAVFLDKTKTPNVRTITPGADPAKNHLNVGPLGAPTPSGVQDLGYTAEVVWDLSTLGLTSGHSYRMQLMVHDGDQNKTGGDVGQACVNVTY